MLAKTARHSGRMFFFKVGFCGLCLTHTGLFFVGRPSWWRHSEPNSQFLYISNKTEITMVCLQMWYCGRHGLMPSIRKPKKCFQDAELNFVCPLFLWTAWAFPRTKFAYRAVQHLIAYKTKHSSKGTMRKRSLWHWAKETFLANNSWPTEVHRSHYPNCLVFPSVQELIWKRFRQKLHQYIFSILQVSWTIVKSSW